MGDRAPLVLCGGLHASPLLLLPQCSCRKGPPVTISSSQTYPPTTLLPVTGSESTYHVPQAAAYALRLAEAVPGIPLDSLAAQALLLVVLYCPSEHLNRGTPPRRRSSISSPEDGLRLHCAAEAPSFLKTVASRFLRPPSVLKISVCLLFSWNSLNSFQESAVMKRHYSDGLLAVRPSPPYPPPRTMKFPLIIFFFFFSLCFIPGNSRSGASERNTRLHGAAADLADTGPAYLLHQHEARGVRPVGCPSPLQEQYDHRGEE